jgi:hypothetical protein
VLLSTFMPDPAGEGGSAGAGGSAPAAGATPPAGGGAAGGAPPAGGAAPGGDAKPWSFPTDKPFAEYLPERVRTDPSFRDIKSFENLAESFVNAQRLVGADKATILQIPKDDDAKAWADFYAKTGRPEKPEGYKIPKRADGKEYDADSQGFQKAMVPKLHEAGLSQRQIDMLVPAWNAVFDNADTARADADAADRTKAETALKAEWGTAYDDKLKLAQSAINHYAGELKITDAVLAELDSTKLGNTPGLAKMLAHLGAQLKEDGLIGKGDAGFAAALSPAEARQQINAMASDETAKKALLDPKHPQHRETVERRAKLYEQAYPPA